MIAPPPHCVPKVASQLRVQARPSPLCYKGAEESQARRRAHRLEDAVSSGNAGLVEPRTLKASSPGDGIVSPLEATAAGVRRIEAPVLVDRRGTVWTPGLIDVTLRCRDRPVLVESPPPEMSLELARSLREAAARFAGARGAAGAFTVSFLADLASGEHRFLGTAAGLPAGAAVLEARDETDLAALEAHLSRGGTLDAQPPDPRGHALQVCLSALDPEDGFTPSPGVVEALRLPAGPGLRADP